MCVCVSSDAADKVLVEGEAVPYVPLSTSFSDYVTDCWTYDGRLDTLNTHQQAHTLSLSFLPTALCP